MINQNFSFERFINVVTSGQAYLNIVYLLVAFPLGIFYFVFIVTGFSAGVPLLIVWLGIPILLLVIAGWWLLANFERQMAIHWLKQDISPMHIAKEGDTDLLTQLKDHLTNPVTWKSLLYLFLKFPLGVAAFVVTITAMALTLSFLLMPFIYQGLPFLDFEVSFGLGMPVWQINSLSDALMGSLIGLVLWPISLHITNGLTWVNAQMAKALLGGKLDTQETDTEMIAA